MRAVVFGAALALVVAGPALADGPIVTAPAAGVPAPQPTAPAPALPPSVATAPDAGQAVAMGPCGPEKVKADGTLDTAPHAEVDASVGSNGYRHIAGAVCQPIGQDGFVAVSLGESQLERGDHRH